MNVLLRSVVEFQRLRLIARGNNEPVTGRVLRFDKSRTSKDGTFLDELVNRGLLEVAEPAESPADPQRNREPVQFRTTYRLTVMGLAAADTGVYVVPEPHPLPVRDRNAPIVPAKRADELVALRKPARAGKKR